MIAQHALFYTYYVICMSYILCRSLPPPTMSTQNVSFFNSCKNFMESHKLHFGSLQGYFKKPYKLINSILVPKVKFLFLISEVDY